MFRAFIILLLLSFSAQSAEPVLLVGNSFTGYTDTQILQKNLFATRWVGGWNLDQHFHSSTTNSMVCDQRTFVVLQDFSTRASDSAAFQLDMDEMIPLVRSCKAVPLLFMTWETIHISYTPIKNAYEQAAAKHQAQLIPIGTIWHLIRLQNESFYQSLLQADGKHPSVRGSKVAAACILKSFCESCYQSFDWGGFTNNERTFIQGLIAQHIQPAIIPEPEYPAKNVLPGILQLLLDA